MERDKVGAEYVISMNQNKWPFLNRISEQHGTGCSDPIRTDYVSNPSKDKLTLVD
jgi:hypothetical protein